MHSIDKVEPRKYVGWFKHRLRCLQADGKITSARKIPFEVLSQEFDAENVLIGYICHEQGVPLSQVVPWECL